MDGKEGERERMGQRLRHSAAADVAFGNHPVAVTDCLRLPRITVCQRLVSPSRLFMYTHFAASGAEDRARQGQRHTQTDTETKWVIE